MLNENLYLITKLFLRLVSFMAFCCCSKCSQQHMNNLSPTAAATANSVAQKHLANGYATAALNAVTTTATMPLNLNIQQSTPSVVVVGGTVAATAASTATVSANGVIGGGLQIISNGRNGSRSQIIELSNEHTNATTIMNGNGKLAKDQIKLEALSSSASKMDSEPPTKVIKLLNRNTIALASVDKDNKLIPSVPMAMQQMVVSHIPLLASSQAVRVIGQTSNGLATIELSNGNGKYSTSTFSGR